MINIELRVVRVVFTTVQTKGGMTTSRAWTMGCQLTCTKMLMMGGAIIMQTAPTLFYLLLIEIPLSTHVMWSYLLRVQSFSFPTPIPHPSPLPPQSQTILREHRRALNEKSPQCAVNLLTLHFRSGSGVSAVSADTITVSAVLCTSCASCTD